VVGLLKSLNTLDTNLWNDTRMGSRG